MISLVAGEHGALRAHVHDAGEPLATLAGCMIRGALTDRGATRDAPLVRRAGPACACRARVPAAAPGLAADAIGVLRARYPHDLRHLPADPAAAALVAEHLTALARWRVRLDAAEGVDPRATLACTHELRAIATWLQGRARRAR